jgi:hypothetical protein
MLATFNLRRIQILLQLLACNVTSPPDGSCPVRLKAYRDSFLALMEMVKIGIESLKPAGTGSIIRKLASYGEGSKYL